MNYGESLAYWYLRLNGFLPMGNFVLHRQGRRGQTTDADILGVRFPYVFEEIGGKPGDWDNEQFDRWGWAHRQSTVCLICEVKTGAYKKSDINRAFGAVRLRIAIERFGIIQRAAAEEIAERLSLHSIVPDVPEGNIRFAKMLIDDEGKRPGPAAEAGVEMTPCCRLTLRESLEFIRNRMRTYRDAKNAGRFFFPGELAQFLAWDSGVDVEAQDDEEPNPAPEA